MAYKTFANGFPLPASDLNNYLMNQSVIVFADSTARTAALPTPTEGMITYLEDTNTVEVYDGAAWTDINDNTAAIPKSTVTTAGDLIVADGASSVTRLGAGSDGSLLTVDSGSPAYLAPGTDDQVLTLVSGAPAWADASGGGGWELLSTTTINTSGANTFVSSIDQSYKNLRVIVTGWRISTARYKLWYIGSETCAYTTTNSSFTGLIRYTSSDIYIGGGLNAIDANSYTSFVIDIPNYSSTTTYKAFSLYGCADISNLGGIFTFGTTLSTNAITELLFQGELPANAGEILVYGGN